MGKAKRQTREGLKEIIREEAFFPLLQAHSLPFFHLYNSLVEQDHATWTKAQVFRLSLETNELQSFLDDFGARKNRTFGYLGELLATLKWLARTAFTLEHVSMRLAGYRLKSSFRDPFLGTFSRYLANIKECCHRVLEGVRQECLRLGLELPGQKLEEAAFTRVRAARFLPENMDEDSVPDLSGRVAEVAARYLAAEEMIRAAFPGRSGMSPEELSLFATRFCREEQVRVCEVAVHNLQSRYDTYIKSTPAEKETPELVRLRGHIAVALHLLECATFLVHLDERHENDLRVVKTRQAIAHMVDRPALLSTIIDFCLPQAIVVLREGVPFARGILGQFTEEDRVELVFPPGISLHARPASLIVSVVNHHGMPVEAEIDGHKANAASIMSMMILAGRNPGARKVAFRGDRRVLQDLKLLFRQCLRMDRGSSFPEELSYLASGEPDG